MWKEVSQIMNCGDKVHPSQIYIDESTHLLHKIFTHVNRFISQLIFKCTNIENSSFTKLFMNSPPMSNNAIVSHAIHVPLSVVSSILSSEKLQKATNKGRDWSEDATSLLLQGFGEMFLAIEKGYFK